MTSDGKLHVRVNHSTKKRNFIARVIQNSKTIKTKTIRYGTSKTVDETYDEIVKAAQEFAKTYKCKYIHKTKHELTYGEKSQTFKKLSGNPSSENPLVTKFGNELAFNAMIKHAIKLHGIDKVSEVLTNAIALTNEMKADIAKRTSAISSANIEIAHIILKTRQAGVDMDSPSKEIDVAIAWVIENDSKPKKQAKGELNGIYELQGEKWNGVGHAPASFSKYLQQNENHSLDDLRVN
jgi:hypothetical protein